LEIPDFLLATVLRSICAAEEARDKDIKTREKESDSAGIEDVMNA